jgi:hypothetical protein
MKIRLRENWKRDGEKIVDVPISFSSSNSK